MHNFMGVPHFCSYIRYFARCCGVKAHWENDNRELQIIYRYSNPVDYNVNRLQFLPENELKYFHPKTGYLDYSSLGIKRVRLKAELV